MAKLFDQQKGLVPTWYEAITFLATQGEAFNMLLEIAAPTTLTDKENAAVCRIDDALRQSDDSSVQHVAHTIFPRQFLNRYPRPEVYDRFVDLMEKKGKKKNTWGTYAMRICRRPGKTKDTFFYPLDTIITKLKQASGSKTPFRLAYEMGVLEPNDDIFPFEIPTYNGVLDARLNRNMPCLSHLTFKMVKRTHVNLTALYRSHYYCSKSLGNLIGLRDLLAFVAGESGLQVGTLTCLSSYAKFDAEAWGGAVSAKAVLKGVGEDLAA